MPDWVPWCQAVNVALTPASRVTDTANKLGPTQTQCHYLAVSRALVCPRSAIVILQDYRVMGRPHIRLIRCSGGNSGGDEASFGETSCPNLQAWGKPMRPNLGHRCCCFTSHSEEQNNAGSTRLHSSSTSLTTSSTSMFNQALSGVKLVMQRAMSHKSPFCSLSACV